MGVVAGRYQRSSSVRRFVELASSFTVDSRSAHRAAIIEILRIFDGPIEKIEVPLMRRPFGHPFKRRVFLIMDTNVVAAVY